MNASKRLPILIILVVCFTIGTLNRTLAQSNLQQRTPSALLPPGKWEYKLFNNLYTETQGFDPDGNLQDRSQRGSYFKSINQFLYGVSPDLDIGVEWWISSVKLNATDDTPFDLFRFKNSPSSRTAFAYAGPRIKFVPFSSLEGFSVESTWLFPVAPNLEGSMLDRPFLAEDRYSWLVQLYYDHQFNDKVRLFTRLAPWLSIDREFEQKGSSFSLPLSTFLSYIATDRLSFYLQSEGWPTFGSERVISSWFLQEGIGAKYQVVQGKLELELLYTDFLLGRNAGAGRTFNLGIRLLNAR